jgi:RNA recognition motif-containing protein
MISKTTGLSRGFGFVSFAARNEAIAAIEEMNGFRLGKKRFKVQLKRTQDDNFDQFNEDFDDEDSFNEADIDGMYTTHSNSGVNTRSSSPNYTNNNHHKKLLKNDKSMENMLPLEERNRASSMDKIYSKSSSSSVSNVENNRNTTTNGYDNKRIPLNSSMKSQSHQSIDTIDLKNSPTLKRITKSVSISDATKQFEAIQINNDLQSRTTTVESGK